MNNGIFLSVVGIAVSVSCSASAQNQLTITTWNIEHLGSPGRGFGGGFGSGNLPKRTDEDLQKLAKFIQDDLGSDVLVLQEIAITRRRRGASFSAPLNKMIKELANQGQLKWNYFLPPVDKTPPDEYFNQYLGFMWNARGVRLLRAFEMDLKNLALAGKNLFDRKPLAGYFEAIDARGSSRNDFVLVNVHFGSGQDNDENHLIAMTLIEFELARNFGKNAITEEDIVILGDFNDNPHFKKRGQKTHSPALYEHMRFKGYVDLVPQELKATRMNNDLDSLIDHILVNQAAKQDVPTDRAVIFRPGGGDSSVYADWRKTYSDHFPLSFRMTVRDDLDPDFFQ